MEEEVDLAMRRHKMRKRQAKDGPPGGSRAAAEDMRQVVSESVLMHVRMRVAARKRRRGVVVVDSAVELFALEPANCIAQEGETMHCTRRGNNAKIRKIRGMLHVLC